MTTDRRRLAVLLVLVASLVALAAPPAAPAPARTRDDPGKLLLVTAPGLRWADLASHDLPNIEGWLADAGVAMLSMRTLGARTGIGEGYATIGAGNRASAGASTAGLALEPREPFEEGSARQAYQRRTGVEATGELLHLAFPTIERTNNRYNYGAEPGRLGSTLAEAGLTIGMVANADVGLTLAADVLSPELPAPDVPVGPEEEIIEEEGGGSPEEPPVEEEPEVVDEVAEDEERDDAAPLPLPLVASDYGRSAALAAMDDTGQVAVGAADRLLRRDPEAPFGVRYHPDAVVQAFEEVWAEADAAIVELSDLDRADGYRRDVARDVAAEHWARALRGSDELFGRIVEAAGDGTTVLLVTPAPPRAAETLGVFAMSDGSSGGHLARSATTRRPGYVALVDVGPTILDHFGVDQPTAMTGTAVTAVKPIEVDQDRFELFAGTTAEAIFRDAATGPISVVFVIVQILAYALAVVAVARRRRWTIPVSFLALVVLATPTVVYLAGALRVDGGSVAAYAFGIFGAAVALAAAAEALGGLAGRRWPRTRATFSPLLLVSLTWLVLAVDIVTGGRLQINTVFGYSPLVAGRFAGFGNIAFALVAIGAVVVACGAWATARLASGRADGSATLRGVPVLLVVGFLVFTVVIDGAPMWGSDVGGVLATVPAFAVLVLVAMGVRVDWRRAVMIAAGTIVAITAFAAVDLARREEDRTHLGRLVTRVVDDGGEGFLEIIRRKLTTNVNILFSSVWTLTIPFALGFLVYLARRQRGFLRDLQDAVPGIRAMLAGGLLVAVLGFALNDSGVAVPAMMFAVLLPYLTYVLLRWDPEQR